MARPVRPGERQNSLAPWTAGLADRACRFHVCPWPCAKPVIDILLVVADSADDAGYAPSLESAGYRVVVREPDWHEHRMVKGPDADINLHVFSEDCPEIDRMLASVTGCAPTQPTAHSTNKPSATSPGTTGRKSKTTPTQRVALWAKSCAELVYSLRNTVSDSLRQKTPNRIIIRRRP
jgi:hypothetical protein